MIDFGISCRFNIFRMNFVHVYTLILTKSKLGLLTDIFRKVTVRYRYNDFNILRTNGHNLTKCGMHINIAMIFVWIFDRYVFS